jgi:tape measure domain-containing protein
MGTVLTVQGRITGDASSLLNASKQASRAIKDLQDSAAADRISDMAEKGANGLSRVISTAVKAAAAVTAIGTAAAGALAFKALQGGLSRMEEIQDSTVALTRMMGSAADAANLTAAALKVVTGTPFALPDFDVAARKLYAYGVSAEKIPPILQSIADSAAASGEGADAVQGLVGAFAQMSVEGKVSLETLQEFGNAGVNGLGILANHFGVTTEAMRDMISYGFVPSGEAMDALVDGIENGSHGIAGNFNAIAGAAQDLGQTVSGSLGNLKTAVARMGATILTPFQSQIPDVINKALIPAFDNAGKVLGKLSTALADSGALQSFEKHVQDLTKNFEPFVRSVVEVVSQLSPLGLVFKALSAASADATGPLADMGRLFLQQFVPALSRLGQALAPIIPAFAQIADALTKGLLAAMPAVIGTVQIVVGVFQALAAVLQALPAPAQALVVAFLAMAKFGVLATVLKGVASALGLVSAKATETAASTTAAGAAAEKSGGKFAGMASKALGIATIAVAAIEVGNAVDTAFRDGAESVNQLSNAIAHNSDGFGGWTAAVKRANGAWGTYNQFMDQAIGLNKNVKVNIDAMSNGFVQFAQSIPLIGDQFKGSLAEFSNGLTQLSQQNLPASQKAFRTWADSNNLSLGELNKALNTKSMEDYKNQLVNEANQAGVSANKNNLLALAMGQAGIATGGARQKIQDFLDSTNAAGTSVDTLADKIAGLGSAQVNADTAEINFQQSVQSATDTLQQQKDAYTAAHGSLDGFKASLDTTTESGRENKQALDNIAVAAEQNAVAILKNKGSQEQANQAIADGRQKLIDMLGQFGITGAAADGYADKLGLIPRDVGTNLHSNAMTAAGDVTYFKNQLDSISSTKYVNIIVQTSGLGAGYNHLGITATGGIYGKAFANGGMTAFASGGTLPSGMYKGGGYGLIKFAEKETNWEAYISGRFGQEDRNRQILMAAAARLGMLDQKPSGPAGPLVHVENYGTDPQVTATMIQHQVVNAIELIGGLDE